MKLIVGLGNPGRGYARSRHNVGFMCVDGLSSRSGIPLTERRSSVVLGRGQVERESVVLAKPRTYMNRSGDALAYLVARFGVALPDMLIVYDDMDLPLGKLRIRAAGSAGGHRGMQSIINALGSQEVPRMRIGIGRPLPDEGGVEHVLGSFAKDEQPALRDALSAAQDAALDVIAYGLERAMNHYN